MQELLELSQLLVYRHQSHVAIIQLGLQSGPLGLEAAHLRIKVGLSAGGQLRSSAFQKLLALLYHLFHGLFAFIEGFSKPLLLPAEVTCRTWNREDSQFK